jgi:hypothetical protein
MQVDGVSAREWIRFAAGAAAGIVAMALFAFRWPPDTLVAPLLGLSAMLMSSRRRGDRVESTKDLSTAALVVALALAALVFALLMIPNIWPAWRALLALTWFGVLVMQLRIMLRDQFKATESM